jgi:hypothetical protein
MRRTATTKSSLRRRRSRRDGDDGAVLVEFALVLPLLLLMLLGIITGGLAYNQRLQVTHAVREGARYGATVPALQDWNSGTWASNVQALVVERSAGDLDGSQVCVALVEGASASVVNDGGRGAGYYSTTGAPCFADSYPQYNANDQGRRVQVRAVRPARIQLGIAPDLEFELVGEATARAEWGEE